MSIHGDMFIGARARPGSNGSVRAIEAATGASLEPAFGGATAADLDEACEHARQATIPYAQGPLAARAAFLDKIADNILGIGDELIERAMMETGLPRLRLESERGRTMGQLRLFADVVRSGDFLGVRIDPAMPDRVPHPRPDLRLRHIPLGPVAVFGASNFPLAFSVAGGDTASALAAGCPVIAKSHPAHPGTSELVARAVQHAVCDCGMPDGTFSLLFDSGHAIGAALVAHPVIAAVGFTGSRRGGLALHSVAQDRPVPIPFYAEMSSINPVVLLPHALTADAEGIATRFVHSMALGAGQFCTNPGIVFGIEGPELDRFLASAAVAVRQLPAAVMLTPGICAAYRDGVATLAGNDSVRLVARGQAAEGNRAQAALYTVADEAFLMHRELQNEIFGAASLVVRCASAASLARVIASLEGQLTAALHLTNADHDAARLLLPLLERKVGRILVNDFGTGVEVSSAMVHGGPYPSTTDGRTTSVGTLAIARFLRPVCYQNLPDALLPDTLQQVNPLGIPRKES